MLAIPSQLGHRGLLLTVPVVLFFIFYQFRSWHGVNFQRTDNSAYRQPKAAADGKAIVSGNVMTELEDSSLYEQVMQSAHDEVDCPTYLRRRYGPNRFTRIPWQTNTANITFPEGFPVLDAQACMPRLSTKKVAVLLEMRAEPNWVYHLMHFVKTLGDDWPILVYHSVLNELMLRDNEALQPHILSGRVQLHRLNTAFMTSDHVSQFLTHRSFWEALAPADHILMFQIDSTLCSGATSKIEDFFKYDYIGAPITTELGETPMFNGGFSLRNRQAMLQVIDHERAFDHPDNEQPYEDRWFSLTMAHSARPFRLPTTEEAKAFAVESFFHPHPVGVHRPRRFLPGYATAKEVEQLFRNCPEADKMPDRMGGDFIACLNDPSSQECKEGKDSIA